MPYNSSKGRTAKPVRPAPKEDKRVIQKEKVAAKSVDVLPHTGNVCVTGTSQPESSSVVQTRLGVSSPSENGAVLQARYKRQRQDLIKPPPENNKVSQDARFQKPPEPQAIRKEASPEDVYAALIKIPDLACEDFLKSYNIFRCDNFEFRSLMALPLEMRKD